MYLSCNIRTYSQKAQSHTHEYNQLIIPIYGELAIKIDGKDFVLDDNHIFLVPDRQIHDFRSQRENKFLILDISANMNRNICSYSKPLDDQWKALRFLLQKELKSNNPDRLYHLAEYSMKLLGDGTEPKSIRYIHEHYNEQIRLEDIAKLESYSQSYYYEWFKRKYNMTPMQYIQNIRLEKSKRLLLDTDMSIGDIAFEVGFKYQSSLSRLYKSTYTISPNQYRKKNMR